MHMQCTCNAHSTHPTLQCMFRHHGPLEELEAYYLLLTTYYCSVRTMAHSKSSKFTTCYLLLATCYLLLTTAMFRHHGPLEELEAVALGREAGGERREGALRQAQVLGTYLRLQERALQDVAGTIAGCRCDGCRVPLRRLQDCDATVAGFSCYGCRCCRSG